MDNTSLNHCVYNQGHMNTELEAVSWVAMLNAAGMLWHFDDDPADVFDLDAEQVGRLILQSDKARKLIAQGETFDDIFDVAMDLSHGGERVNAYLKQFAVNIEVDYE